MLHCTQQQTECITPSYQQNDTHGQSMKGAAAVQPVHKEAQASECTAINFNPLRFGSPRPRSLLARFPLRALARYRLEM